MIEIPPAPIQAQTTPAVEALPSPETEPATSPYDGLKGRLLGGPNYLDPATVNLAPVTAELLTNEANKTAVWDKVSAASGKERGRVTQTKDVWVTETAAKLTEAHDFLTQTDQGRQWKTLFTKFGYANNDQNFVSELYTKYCQGDAAKPSEMEKFKKDVFNAYTTTTNGQRTVNFADLKRDQAAINWMANIFGVGSAEITKYFIEAEAEAIQNPTEFLQKVNKTENNTIRINALNDTGPRSEKKLLQFLKDPQNVTIQAEPYARPVTPRPATPTPGAQPPLQAAPELSPVERTLVENLKRDYFDKITGDLLPNDPNVRKYFVDNPPASVTLTPDQKQQLESRLPYFTVLPGGGVGTNRDAVPYVWEFDGDFLNRVDKNQRFMSGDDLTNGDSGLIALSGISAPDSEKQAKLYKLLAENVLAVHQNNPNLMKQWLEKQIDEQEAYPGTGAGMDLFNEYDYYSRNDIRTLQLDPGLENTVRPKNERLSIFSANPPTQAPEPPDTFSIMSIDQQVEFVQEWTNRVTELSTAMQSGQLLPHHHRWLEMLGHSVNIPQLINKFREAAPAPQPQPTAEFRANQNLVNTLRPIFEQIQGNVEQNNNPYFIQNPPETITFTSQELDSLHNLNPYATAEMRFTNGSKIRYDNRFNDITLQRFGHALESGSVNLAVSSIASETPENQAKVYKLLNENVLKVHLHDPELLKKWAEIQLKNAGQTYNPSVTIDDFPIDRFLDQDLKQTNPELKILPDAPANIREVKMDKLQAMWTPRIEELKQAMESGNINEKHIAWLEFLSNSVDTKKIIEKIKTSQTPETAKSKNYIEITPEQNLQGAQQFITQLRERLKNGNYDPNSNTFEDPASGISIPALSQDQVEKAWFNPGTFKSWADKNNLPIAFWISGNHARLLLTSPLVDPDGKYRVKLYNPMTSEEQTEELNITDDYMIYKSNKIDSYSFVTKKYKLKDNTEVAEQDIDHVLYSQWLNSIIPNGVIIERSNKATELLAKRLYNLSFTDDTEMPEQLRAGKTQGFQKPLDTSNCIPLSFYSAALRYTAKPGDNAAKVAMRDKFAADFGIKLLTRQEFLNQTPQPQP